MEKELAMRWVEALKSGHYKQGRGWLHDRGNNTWCCLGVLCDVGGFKSESRHGLEGPGNPLKSNGGFREDNGQRRPDE
jgi:hypothetical protein